MISRCRETEIKRTGATPGDSKASSAKPSLPTEHPGFGHLRGLSMPPVVMPSTKGRMVNFAALPESRTIIFCCPSFQVGGVPLHGGCDQGSVAAECVQQVCGYRDCYWELASHGVDVFGVSTQPLSDQRPFAEQLQLPYELLSDSKFRFCHALGLLASGGNGQPVMPHLTVILRYGTIRAIFDPLPSPRESPAQVINWFKRNNYWEGRARVRLR